MPYSDCLVSYFDVLGFKKLIEKSEQDANEITKIERILEAFARKGSYNWEIPNNGGLEGIVPEPLAHIRTFSDLIVRVTPINARVGFIAHLALELGTLARIQWELLALYNVLLRGGICQKPVHCEGNIFGPGIVYSYELEKTAVYPRIIVDGDLARRGTSINAPVPRLLQRGEDGLHFVDYLTAKLFSDRDHAIETLARHKQFILEEIEKFKNERDKSIRQKYVWMAFYHNSTLKNAIEEFEQQELREHEIDMQNIW